MMSGNPWSEKLIGRRDTVEVVECRTDGWHVSMINSEGSREESI